MTTGSIKPIAREAAMDYMRKFFQREPDKLNDRQRSEGFLRWYIAEVHNLLGSPFLDDDDVAAGYTDNSGDLEVDFIHRDTSGRVLVIQSKYHGKGKPESIGEIHKFGAVLEKMRDPKMRALANKKLKGILEDINFATDSFELVFISAATFTPQLDAQVEAMEKSLTSIEGLDVQVEFLSETHLNERFRSASKFLNGMPGRQEFHLVDGTEALSLPGDNQSVVLIVDGLQLAGVYRQAKDPLFASNIRAFLGVKGINKEVANTIVNDPERFYYYNNGICCLAKSLKFDGRKVSVEGLQVINGAQTVRSLAHAEKKYPAELRKVRVLVRITVRKQGYGEEGRFIENIVRFNNSQNATRPADFVSNDPVQNDLRKRFGEYKRLGRDVVYLNKRGEKPAAGKESIDIIKFAKDVYAFLIDPIKFAGSSAFLFELGAEKGYVNVFGDGQNPFDPRMPDDEFHLRSAIWWLSQEFDTLLRIDRASLKYGAALERKHFVLFAARLILQRNYGDAEYRKFLAKYYKGDWQIEKAEAPGPLFKRLYTLSRDSVNYVYKTDESEQGDSFSQRAWMRSQKTTEKIRLYCESAPGLDTLKLG